MATIKYKDTTILVEAGQTVTLNTADKKLTGDIEVIVPAEKEGGGSSVSVKVATCIAAPFAATIRAEAPTLAINTVMEVN